MSKSCNPSVEWSVIVVKERDALGKPGTIQYRLEYKTPDEIIRLYGRTKRLQVHATLEEELLSVHVVLVNGGLRALRKLIGEDSPLTADLQNLVDAAVTTGRIHERGYGSSQD